MDKLGGKIAWLLAEALDRSILDEGASAVQSPIVESGNSTLRRTESGQTP